MSGSVVAPPKVSFLNKSPVYEIKYAVTIIISIVSFSLAISAFVELAAVTSDVSDILDNWETQPILDIYLIDPTMNCEDPFFEYAFDNSDFGGVKRGNILYAFNLL